jgi:hypothetical protein
MWSDDGTLAVEGELHAEDLVNTLCCRENLGYDCPTAQFVETKKK